MTPDRPVHDRDAHRRQDRQDGGRPLPPVPPSNRRSDGADQGRPRDGALPPPPPPYPVAPPPAARRRPLPPHPQATPPANPPGNPASPSVGSAPSGAALPPLPPVPPPAPRRERAREGERQRAREGDRRPPLPPPPLPRPRFVPADDTQLIPVLPPVPRHGPETEEEIERREGAPGASTGILRAAGTMAVATLVSRITGLLRTVVLLAALGAGLVGDAYNTSNTLPNILYELVIGGVLSSVVVPLLVHAQDRDRDGGIAYAQRLATIAVAGLALVTVLAVAAAPLLTWAYGIRDDPGQVALANWLARLLLIEVVFYGIGALATAILNSRDVFGPPAWAPVLNNLVVIATGALFIAGNPPGRLTPVTISSWQVWLLGLGTTLGIAVQALVLVPLLRKVGVPLRPRWGLRQTGLREAGTLGLWVIGYAAISQIGVLVATNVANSAGHEKALGSQGFATASLLFQMPYGIIGVALLTALLPRMSRAASRSDLGGVVRDLALGTRLSALGLLPVTAALIVLGPALAIVGFRHGQTTWAQAHGIGVALAVGAFGLLPMAVTLLQLRVFYAMRDAKTPTLIQLGMVTVRVPLLLLVPVFVAPAHVVAGLMVVTSLTYVAGWVLGEVLLRRRLGQLETGETLGQLLRVAAASAVAAVLGWLVTRLTEGIAGTAVAGSLVTLVVGTVVIGVAALVGSAVARVPELQEPLAVARTRARDRFGRG